MSKFAKSTLLTLAAFLLLGFSITVNAKPGNDDAPPTFDVNVVNTDVPVTILNDSENPVPVDVQGEVATTQRVPITVSGDWDGGGLYIDTPMIIKDVFFYGENVIGLNECGIHFHDSGDRVFYVAVLGIWESVKFHFEAGISYSDIYFGSSSDCDQTNYMMMGYSIE